MFDNLPIWLNNIIESIIFAMVCIVLYFAISSFLKISLNRISKDVKDYNRKITTGKLVISSLKYFMVALFVIGVLVLCGVEVGAIITGAGLLSIAIGFGAQSLVNDVISGLFIFFEKQYDVGDVILIEGFTGEVVSLGFKSTVLKNWLGDIFVIGNGKINSVINYSQANSVALVKVRVEADTDFEKLKNAVEVLLAKVVSDYDYFVAAPEYKGVGEISSSGIQIIVTAQTKPMRHIEAERVIRKGLLDIFEAEGISFSSPKIQYRGIENV